jgi:ABC-type iron transport system FetAB ATPase subunit
MPRINEITSQISSLEKDVSSLHGQCSLLNEQLAQNEQSLKDLQSLQIKNQKFIELLHLVKKVTQENIKLLFEKVVTEALQYIHQDNDYKFELEFSRRGQLPELKFNIKTPEMKETHDIIDTRGGGTADIVSLALRFVLLEISKMPGFLFLDEPEKHLDSPETLNKMLEFVKEMQKETHRQIFWITHKQEVVDSVENPIIIKKSNYSQITEKQLINTVETSTAIEGVNIKLEEPKKKRGRPKGSIKKEK